MKKKIVFILVGILLLFIITNPSPTAFKEYQGRNSYSGLRRTFNLFLFSEYKDHGDKFIGVVGNFWEIKHIKRPTINLDSLHEDSAKMTDTSIHYDEYGIKKKKYTDPTVYKQVER